ncbi:MAG TPA: SLBB domain-containing protein [Armatimonadota bacterium]|jgi:protein involved in polysaccharide export with SLBB domain
MRHLVTFTSILALLLFAGLCAERLLAEQGAPVPTTAPANAVANPPNAATAKDGVTEPKTQGTLAPSAPAVFGRDLFSNAGTFEPNPDTPVPANYLLGAGDALEIVCWYGSTEYEHTTVTLAPNGAIYLKLVGTLNLQDKTLQQAESELRQRYARYYTKMELTVKVSGRRTIPVFVVGEVDKPGKFFLSSLATVFTALYAAGGPSDTGSLRTIRVMRGQQTVGTIDIYDYLLKGAITDLPLKSGDTVFVPVAKTVVTLAGEIHRPAKYELLTGDTLAAAIALAGGTTSQSANRISLSRVGETHQRQVLDLTLPADETMPLRDGDVVQVGAVLPFARNAVMVEGAVNRPGAYPIEKAPTVSALLDKAEGVTHDAYLPQAELYRYAADGQTRMVAIDLGKALAHEPKDDLALHAMDRLVIHARKDIADLLVRVEGEVNGPGAFPFYDGMKLSDLVLQAGGVKTTATLDHALLTRINPTNYAEDVVDISLRGVLTHETLADLSLRNGDRLTVFPLTQVAEQQSVSIEGAVVASGKYPYIGNMRVSHLLLLAKGIKADAYMQRANLYRLQPDHSTETIPVDLTLAATGVESEANPILCPQDRLVIANRDEKQAIESVKVDGCVRTPGSFRIGAGMKLSDALYLAGGPRPEAARSVDVYHKVDGQIRTTTYAMQSINGKLLPTADPLLAPDDLVSVREDSRFAHATETVSVEGEVHAPGAFPAYHGARQDPLTLYQALKQAGDLMPGAYQPGIVLYRKQAALYTTVQQWELTKTMSNLDSIAGVKPTLPAQSPMLPATANGPDVPLNDLLTNQGGAAAQTVAPAGKPASLDSAEAENVNSLANSLAKVITTGKDTSVALIIPPRSLQNQQFSVSIPVDVETLMRSQGKEGDIALEPDDIVYVPKRPVTVTVLGGVTNNGSVTYQPGKTLNDYLNAVGGVSPDGDMKRTVVMHVNGQLAPVKQAKTIRPGDIIIVPTKVIVQTIHTEGVIPRLLQSISQMALSILPFKK